MKLQGIYSLPYGFPGFWGPWFSILQFALITDVCGDKDIAGSLVTVTELFTVCPRCAVFVQNM